MKNVFRVLALLSLPLLLYTCEARDPSESLNPLLDKYLEAWNTANPSLFKGVVDSSFELRKPPDFKPARGIRNLEDYLISTHNSIPDFLLTVTERVFLGDTAVAVSWIFTGTYNGENDLPPTGSKINIPGFSIIYFNDNKVTGEWITFSDLTWMKQLGFGLTPPAGK